MKKIILITFALFCIGIFTNCVKKKNCDCGTTGYYVYVENSSEFYKEKGIKAIIKTNPNSIYYIDKGIIPKKFRSKSDTIKVNFCIEHTPEKYITVIIPEYKNKLKCIEEIE